MVARSQRRSSKFTTVFGPIVIVAVGLLIGGPLQCGGGCGGNQPFWASPKDAAHLLAGIKGPGVWRGAE
eukprot:4860035-Pyramimonas_sp.AAC.1